MLYVVNAAVFCASVIISSVMRCDDVRECPLSFSAVHGLLSLGVKWQEVEMLVLPEIPPQSIVGVNW